MPIEAPSGLDLHPEPRSVVRIGTREITNYRVKDQHRIVERVFDRASLALGSGKQAQKVEITHGHK
jgi:type IV secretory pathway VirB9-like protein